jgi:hypothetical protein
MNPDAPQMNSLSRDPIVLIHCCRKRRNFPPPRSMRLEQFNGRLLIIMQAPDFAGKPKRRPGFGAALMVSDSLCRREESDQSSCQQTARTAVSRSG